LDKFLKVAPTVRLEQTSALAAGAWSQTSGRLYRVGGLEYAGALDAQSAAALIQFDGRHPVRECLAQLATTLNVDPAVFMSSALAIIRRLIEQGFLLPVNSDKQS